MTNELQTMFELIDDIEVAMLTTRRTDGHLESRAMATQKRAPGADIWFVTMAGTRKLQDIERDPHVNLSYYRERTREWVSVSGLARPSHDRATMRALYDSSWRTWLPEEGDSRHGTADDPRLVLIAVDVHAAVFLEVNKPKPVVLYEMAKGWLTGEMPDIGQTHVITK